MGWQRLANSAPHITAANGSKGVVIEVDIYVGDGRERERGQGEGKTRLVAMSEVFVGGKILIYLWRVPRPLPLLVEFEC